MNFQNKPSNEIIDILSKLGLDWSCCDYYAFPQTFGSTSGPGGLGGSAMSTFTVEAWVSHEKMITAYICAGRVKVRKGEYKGSWY